jgi:Terminase large subunit, T4likevirus-type, N-terminal
MKPNISIDQALADPKLLGAALGEISTWRTWLAVLRAAFGLELDPAQRELFDSVAGGRSPPTSRVRELWCVVARRSGKSRMAAALAVHLALFNQHRLAPGEVGHVLCMSHTKDQAALVRSYARAFLEESPVLRQEIEEITAEVIRLKGNVCIGVQSANFRSVRGRSLIGVVADESAWFRDETSSQPDVEIHRACRPALTASGGMWIGISSPYSQRGLLYQRYRDHFAQPGDILVVQGATREFNPTMSEEQIAKEVQDDPESAEAEWFGRFRSDLATYIDRATLEECIERGVRERPYQHRFRYHAHCDPSGGQHDSMTVAIGHKDGDRMLLDLAQEYKAPFDPQDTVSDIVGILKRYRISSVTGDVSLVPKPDSCSAAKDVRSCDAYSITSSARADSPGGTSSPSVLAVLRLITNSNLVA